MSDNVTLVLEYPSAKEQIKQAFVGTAIGVMPVLVFIGGCAIWAKVQEKRTARAAEAIANSPK